MVSARKPAVGIRGMCRPSRANIHVGTAKPVATRTSVNGDAVLTLATPMVESAQVIAGQGQPAEYSVWSSDIGNEPFSKSCATSRCPSSS